MSKYKVGDTFLLKIKRIRNDGEYVVGEKSINGCETCLAIPEYGLDELVQYSESKTYEDGLADAWEAARKICCTPVDGGMDYSELREVFGNDGCSEPMRDNTPQEAIAKIKEWEDSKEIRRGDEMVHVMDVNEKMIVTYIAVDNDFIHGISRTGDLYSCSDPANWRKTGRNFADKLDALLLEIGGTGDVEKV